MTQAGRQAGVNIPAWLKHHPAPGEHSVVIKLESGNTSVIYLLQRLLFSAFHIYLLQAKGHLK